MVNDLTTGGPSGEMTATVPATEGVPDGGWRDLGVDFLLVALTGLAWIVVGGVDFVAGITIDARILGALNVAAGSVWLSSAIGFRYRTVISLAITFSGGVLAIVYGAYFVGQWWRFGQDRFAVAVLAVWLVLLGVRILWILSRTWGTYGLTKKTKDLIGAGRFGVPVLAIAGAIGALFQFWYTAAYGPSALPPNLAIEASLSAVGDHTATGIRAYSVDVTIENVGEARVQVLASWFNVGVSRAIPESADVTKPDRVRLAFEQGASVMGYQPHRTGHYMTTAQPEIVSSGELLVRGWWFEPREKSHLQLLAYADPTAGDVLRVSVGAYIARGSRLTLEPWDTSFGCDAESAPIDTTTWAATEPAVIRRFSTPDVRLAYGWLAHEDGSLSAVPCYAVGDDWHALPARTADDPVVETLEREYGLAFTLAESELSLWPAIPVASPAPSDP